MKIFSKKSYLSTFLLILVVLLGCACSPKSKYSIEGRITTNDGEGLAEVKIALTGGSPCTVTTDKNGYYSLENLVGKNKLTPTRPGLKFEPQTKSVDGQASNLNFQGFIYFLDENLEQAIREELGYFEGPFDRASIDALMILEAPADNIESLSGLESFINLDLLTLSYNQVKDLKPLAPLKKLSWLGLRENKVVDIEPLAQLTSLRTLNLRGNLIKDIKALAQLTSLTNLDLWDNNVESLEPLVACTDLKHLFLSNNKIKDISPLVNMNNLVNLYIDGNMIEDISVLENLEELSILRLAGNSFDFADPEVERIIDLLIARGVEIQDLP